VAELPTMTFLALRFLLAFAALAVFFRRDLAANWRRLLGPGLVIGLWLFGAYSFQTIGLQFTQASRAGFITGLCVVLVPVLEGLMTGRRPPRRALAGVGFALLGLVFLFVVPVITASAASGGPSVAAQRIGDGLVLACTIGFAGHIVSTSRYSSTQVRSYGEAGALAAIQVGVAAAGYVLVCAAQATLGGVGLAKLLPPAATLSHPFSASTAGAVVMTALLATAGAFLAQTAAQRFTPPTHTALIFATEPVFAALFGWLLLGERLGAWGLAGCLLILAGVLVAELPGAAVPASEARDVERGPRGPRSL